MATRLRAGTALGVALIAAYLLMALAGCVMEAHEHHAAGQGTKAATWYHEAPAGLHAHRVAHRIGGPGFTDRS